MAKPVVTLRNTKGSALNYTELDANFTNLRDSTINFTGDAGDTRSMDLNDVTAITGERNIRVTVDEATQTIKIRNTLSDYTTDPNGFENRTDSTISFNSSTRIFTIAPTTTNYRMWNQGQQYTITASKTITIPNTTGIYLVYFDDDSLNYVLGAEPNWPSETPISYVYWNSTTSIGLFTDERHGIRMDASTKEYLHETSAMAYAEGFQASSYTTTGDGSLDAHAQLDIGNGICYDQDIRVEITHSNTPVANTWQQDLQGPARIPVVYHSGATGAWTIDAQTNFPVKNGTSLVTYNLNTAGTWSTPDCSNTYYVAYWIVATNFLNTPIIAIMGQRQDNKLDDASLNNTWASLDLTNFPAEEFRPLYRIIVRTASAYTNTPKAYFAQLDDVRLNVIVSTSAGGGGLTDIVNDTTPQLGGNLDVNGFSIISASNGNIGIEPNGTGTIFLTPDTGNVVSESTITYFGKADSNATIALNTASTSPTKILDIRAVSGSTNVAVQLNSSGTLGLIASANIDCNETVLRSALFRSVGLEYYNAGTVSGTFAPNTVNGTLQEITLSGSITINGFNAAASTQSDYKKMLFLIIKQPSSGGPYTLSSTMKFRNGDKTLSTAANAIDMIEIYHTGADYYAILHKAFA